MPEGEKIDPKDKPNKNSEPGWENPSAWHTPPTTQEAWDRILAQEPKGSPNNSDEAIGGTGQESAPNTTTNQEKPPEAPKK